MNLIERLPSRSGDPQDGDRVPRRLFGATILRIGTFGEGFNLRGGGLGIEYRPADSELPRRLILEFDEREMHVYSDEAISSSSNLD